MKEMIKEFINPPIEKTYMKYLKKFRKEHIPARYNQVLLLNELANPEVDHYISISNRTDGKSFNYIHALLNIAIEYELGITFLSRNMRLRESYQTLLEEIIDFSPLFDRNDFTFIRSQYYLRLDYQGRTVAIISDLNNATELKYFSNYIKKFPIIVYDEFLALENDYLPDEWERLRTIYESIDRVAEHPLIKKPKLFYLGNAVNFESPILHGLKIFNILEKHPVNSARVYHYDFSIMLEINRNDNANEQRNTRAFGSGNDAMTTAQFETNEHNVANDNDREHIKRNPRKIHVKLKDTYLTVRFNKDTLKIILAIESKIDTDYQYNLLLKDNKATSTFLTDSYFDEKHIKKIDRGKYLFDNTFSKNYITNDYHDLHYLKINKLIRETLRQDNLQKEMEHKEQQFKDNYLEETKKGLMKKLWG